MVSGDEPESMVQDVAQQPQLGSSALRDDNATSNPCIYLANRDFFTNVSLIHPKSLSVPSHFRYNNDHINGQFCAAALSNLPESTDITHVSFNDMNLGLLFALFGKYEGKGNHKANAAKIIERNECFKGTIYTNNEEGAEKLRKTWSGQVAGDVYKKKKTEWRKNPNTSDLLAWLTKTIIKPAIPPTSKESEIIDSPMLSVPPTL